jgi:hypothetical protein
MPYSRKRSVLSKDVGAEKAAIAENIDIGRGAVGTGYVG